MDVRRTAVVKLAVSAEQRDALRRTAEQYLSCANRTADYCWSDTSYTECKTNKREVRDALYAELREETDLHYRPNLSKPLSNALSKPSKRVSNGGKRDSVSLNRRSPPKRWTTTRAARLSTATRCHWQLLRAESNHRLFSRQTVRRPTSGTYSPRTTSSARVRFGTTRPLTSSTSTFRRGGHTVTMRFRKIPASPIKPRYRPWRSQELRSWAAHQKSTISEDVNSLAVSSPGTFWQGNDDDHWCREFEKRRSEMQQRGTQAAHNALLRLGKRERGANSTVHPHDRQRTRLGSRRTRLRRTRVRGLERYSRATSTSKVAPRLGIPTPVQLR